MQLKILLIFNQDTLILKISRLIRIIGTVWVKKSAEI